MRHEFRRLLKVPEVADILDVTTSKVYVWAKEGILPGVVRVGCSVRFDPEKLSRFIDAGGSATFGKGSHASRPTL